MIDAHGIYEYIKKYASLEDKVFCDLHKCASPDESFANNLSLLAETSSSFSHVYGDEIKSQLSNISDIDVGFVENCQNIDNELDSWTRARQIQLI